MSGHNYYALLGLKASATDSEIRRAYLKLSLQHHPDKRRGSRGDDVFRSIQEAYETLSCPEKRCLYDFVGAFAVLADCSTASFPPAFQTSEDAPMACSAPCGTSLWSGSPGEVQRSWMASSSSSASRTSPCPSSDTFLSSSPSARGGPNSAPPAANQPPSLHLDDMIGSGTSGGCPGQAPDMLQPAACPSSPSAGLVSPPSCSLLGKRRSPCTDAAPSLPPWQAAPASPPPPQHSLQTAPSAAAAAARTPAQAPAAAAARTPAQAPAATTRAGGSGSAAAAASGPGAAQLGGPRGVLLRSGHSADVHHQLLLTLEEMYCGCVKQLRLQRRVFRRPAGPQLKLPGESLAGYAGAAVAVPSAAAFFHCQPSSLLGLGGSVGAVRSGGLDCPPPLVFDCPPGVADAVEELFRVEVQPGWREGTKVTFRGKGDELSSGGAGDMVLVVVQAAHGRFERRGNDLHTVVEVPLVDALTGGAASLPTLDGRTLVLHLGPTCLQPASQRVVPGEGMPIPPGRARGRAAAPAAPAAADVPTSDLRSRGGAGGGDGGAVRLPAGWSHGDLHVQFRVAFPAELTPAQKEELRGTLLMGPGPARSPQPWVGSPESQREGQGQGAREEPQ